MRLGVRNQFGPRLSNRNVRSWHLADSLSARRTSAIGGEADIPPEPIRLMLFFMSTSVERELGDAETKFTDLVAERLLAHQFNPLSAC